MFGSSSLPSGIHVKVAPYGEASAVPGLGHLTGFAIVEKMTDEPLQALAAHSNTEALIKRWDAVLSASRAERF